MNTQNIYLNFNDKVMPGNYDSGTFLLDIISIVRYDMERTDVDSLINDIGNELFSLHHTQCTHNY